MSEDKKNTWSWDDTMWGGDGEASKDKTEEIDMSASSPTKISDVNASEHKAFDINDNPPANTGDTDSNLHKAFDMTKGGMSADADGASDTIDKTTNATNSSNEAESTTNASTATESNTATNVSAVEGNTSTNTSAASAGSGYIHVGDSVGNTKGSVAAASASDKPLPSMGSYSGESSSNGSQASFDARNPGYDKRATGNTPRPATYAAANRKHYITRAAFIIILIIAMLVTMITSIGGTALYMNYLNGASNEATNYTLTTSDETLSYKSIIKKAEASVVSITTESVTNDIWAQNYVTKGAGSGVIISKNGYIITCYHVVENASKVTVTLDNNKNYTAEIIGADSGNDIAIIKIKANNLTPATYGDSSKLEVGDQVVAIGNPLGSLSGTATTGIISALNRNLTIDNMTLNLFQTDASINPGNSGGGMFDQSGNLIGIVEAKSTGSDIDGLGFATPINKAAKIAKQIIKKGGDVNAGGSNRSGSSGSSKLKAVIGVMVAEIDANTAKEYGYSHGGLLVQSVTSMEAVRVGVQEGDIIYKADGKSTSKMEALTKVLSKKKVGDKVKLSIARESGRNTEITTKLVSVDQSN